MLLSIALIMTLGMFFGWLCKKARNSGSVWNDRDRNFVRAAGVKSGG